MATTATNPKTGEKAILVNNEWKPYSEDDFQRWYGFVSRETGINTDPDDPSHKYDYRSAYATGFNPIDSKGQHWPSQFKAPDHPNRYVKGVDTITGQPAKTATNPETGERVLFNEGLNQWVPYIDAPIKGGLAASLKDIGMSATTEAAKDFLQTARGSVEKQLRNLDKPQQDTSNLMPGEDTFNTAPYPGQMKMLPVGKEREYLSGAQEDITKAIAAIPNIKDRDRSKVTQALMGMARFAPVMATTAISGPAGATATVGQIYGQKYGEYRDQGIDQEAADAGALTSALLSAPVEYAGNIFQIGIIKNMAKSAGLSTKASTRVVDYLMKLRETLPGKIAATVGGVAAGGATEGAEEYIQAYAEAAGDTLAQNPNATSQELFDKFDQTISSDEFKKQRNQAAELGWYGGLMLGGAGAAVSSALGGEGKQKTETPKQAPSLEDTILESLQSGNVTVENLEAAKADMQPPEVAAVDSAIQKFTQPSADEFLDEEPLTPERVVEQAQMEAQNAESIREDEGQVQEAGDERQGGETESGQDLQQQTPEATDYTQEQVDAQNKLDQADSLGLVLDPEYRSGLEQIISGQQNRVPAEDMGLTQQETSPGGIPPAEVSEVSKAPELAESKESDKVRTAYKNYDPNGSETVMRDRRKTSPAELLTGERTDRRKAENAEKRKAIDAQNEFNESTPGHDVKFDGIQDRSAIGKPPMFSYTAQSGPAKGASFNVEEPTTSAINEKLNRMIEIRKPKETQPSGLDKYASGKNSDITTRFDSVGGMRDTFEIKTSKGATVNGYYRNQDFPGMSTKSDRAEIFITSVPESQRRMGIGYNLTEDAIRLVQKNGANTVNLSPTSEGGRAIVGKLKQNGIISGPIRTSETGKGEYDITIGKPLDIRAEYDQKLKDVNAIKRQASDSGIPPSDIREAEESGRRSGEASTEAAEGEQAGAEVDKRLTDRLQKIADKTLPKGIKADEKGSAEINLEIVRHAHNLVKKGVNNFKEFVAKMRERFADVWDRIKPAIQSLYDHVKQVVADERGSVTIGKEPNPAMDLIKKHRAQAKDDAKSAPKPKSRVGDIVEDAYDRLVYQAQDRFNYLKKAQKQEAEARGVSDLPEYMDAYLAELRSHGKMGAKIDDAQEQYVDPLLRLMSKNKISVEDLGEYVLALHAPEANAHLKKINLTKEDVNARKSKLQSDLESVKAERSEIRKENPQGYPIDKRYKQLEKQMGRVKAEIERLSNYTPVENNTALSGMSDTKAARIRSEVEGSDKADAYRKAADIVHAITKAHRDVLRESGLEKESTIDAWEKTYKNYVPLHREGKGGKMPRKGRGFDTRGKSQRRAGSTRDVVNILANTIAGYEHALIRAEKAKVGKAFLNFAKEVEGPWEVNKVEYKPSFNADGLVVYRPDTSFRMADNVFVVRVNGEEHHITFDEGDHNAMRVVSALKSLDSADTGPIVNLMSWFTRKLALVNTGLNPEFILSNFFRDMQTAAYNMSDSEADAVRWKSLGQVGSALRGILQHQKGKRDKTWAKWYEKFRQAGAQTGWIESYKNIEAREKALEKKLKRMEDGTVNSIVRGGEAVLDWVNDKNTAVENAIRLSVFKNLVENGATEARAASIAKELTVNFNRKGNKGQALNAWKLFYNASVQGSARLISAGVKSPKVRKLMGATIVFAAGLDIANRYWGGDDDDGKPMYDKIPDWIKERNLILMMGDGSYIQIPLPWGYNILHVAGQTLGEAVTKKDFNYGDGAMRMGAATVSAFSPIGNKIDLIETLTPSVLLPFRHWLKNEDWAGRKLRPDQDPFNPKPNSQLYWNTARKQSVIVSRYLNEITGGNEIRQGDIDISPEAIDLAIDTALGGAGRVVSDIASAAQKIPSGDSMEPYEVPFLRRVYGRVGELASSQDYYDNVDAVRMVSREYEHYKDDPNKTKEILRGYKAEFLSIKDMERTQKAIKKLKGQKELLEAGKKTPARQKAIDSLDKTIDKLMKSFNKLYENRKNKKDKDK